MIGILWMVILTIYLGGLISAKLLEVLLKALRFITATDPYLSWITLTNQVLTRLTHGLSIGVVTSLEETPEKKEMEKKKEEEEKEL